MQKFTDFFFVIVDIMDQPKYVPKEPANFLDNIT